MRTTYKQAEVDAAVTYLMQGGLNGGELSRDQYFAMLHDANGNFSTDFLWELQLAIDQGHAGLATSKNICRDQWGALSDVYVPPRPNYDPYGFTHSLILKYGIIISG
jgi:hypothetical protein